MVKTKEEFLRNITHCLGRSIVPNVPTPFSVPHAVHHDYLKNADLDELQSTFIKNAESTGTSIYQCDEGKINETILAAINEFGKGPVIIADQEFFKENNTFEVLEKYVEQVKKWEMNLSREENIAYAEKASIGIVKAELALAESGTVVLFSHLGAGRSVSLLPTYTITLIRKQEIRPRLTQAMSFLREQIDSGLPSSVNFVSGASSTADIELIRVQGVHGPMAISYIIVDL